MILVKISLKNGINLIFKKLLRGLKLGMLLLLVSICLSLHLLDMKEVILSTLTGRILGLMDEKGFKLDAKGRKDRQDKIRGLKQEIEDIEDKVEEARERQLEKNQG